MSRLIRLSDGSYLNVNRIIWVRMRATGNDVCNIRCDEGETKAEKIDGFGGISEFSVLLKDVGFMQCYADSSLKEKLFINVSKIHSVTNVFGQSFKEKDIVCFTVHFKGLGCTGTAEYYHRGSVDTLHEALTYSTATCKPRI